MSKEHKIPAEHGDYYCKHWLVLQDGGSDTWLYVCRDSLAYVFIEVLHMVGCCGRDAQSRWDVSVSVVDLFTTSMDQVVDAMRSCGCDEELDFKLELDRLRMAEMLYSCGAKSPMWNEAGGKPTFDSYGNCNEDYDENCPHFRRLRKEAREFAEEKLLADDEQRNHLMDTKVVNAIGQTAREYAGGIEETWNTLRRIRDDPNATPQQKLVLKMYQGAKQTLGAGPVPKDIVEGKSDG